MKTFILIVMLICPLASGAAEIHRILDKDYKTAGYLKDYRILDDKWQIKGYLRDGNLYDAQWRRVGKIEGKK